MKEYYYLVSSLYDLTLDTGKMPILLEEFEDFCKEELTDEDFLDLKKLFLFNDIKNVINYKKSDDKYLLPAFYTEEEFLENLKDTDSFFTFLSEYFFNKDAGKKIYPELQEIDELTLLFYENLSTIAKDFVEDYFIFELNLKNITTAMACRKANIPYTNKIIPFGDYYEFILKSNTPDFGLGSDFNFIEKLISAYDKDDLLETEKTIEDIRWEYLDSRTENKFFSKDFVFAYAIKLLSVRRWFSMSKEKGEELLNKLIEEIKGNIKFPQEFLKVGGRM